MSAEDIEYMDDYKLFPTKESALDWLDNYLSLDERNNLIRALQQEPRWIHAKWEQIDNEPDTFFTTHQYECSNCGKIQPAKSKNIKKFRYCSKCGAYMRGEK